MGGEGCEGGRSHGFLTLKEWEKWNLDGTGRAELPLDGSTESYAAGMVIDLTSQERVVLSESCRCMCLLLHVYMCTYT